MSTNTNTPDLPDFNTISSLKVNINKESIESLVNCLNGIQIEITNVKGFEVAKTNNSFKYSVKRDMYGSGNIKNTNITSNQINTMNNTNNNPNLDYLRNNTNLVFFINFRIIALSQQEIQLETLCSMNSTQRKNLIKIIDN